MGEIDRFAIVTRKLCFAYESGLNKKAILNCVDINVPQGIIYGLLGPSGCGKTTLLKTVIGLIKPDAGYISVFGHEPRSVESGVPGVGVGYMPQDIAIDPCFKVAEVFKYYGKMYHKSDQFIDERKEFYLNLLSLRDENQLVENLSGGQQRRLSLIVTVFTEPRLLILDEPTVGVDPLLADTIWRFLNLLVYQKSVTVIVTTHYIEEMKFAQKLAFMRDGEVLKEESPQNIMQMCNRKSLEAAFYDISYNQSRRKSSMFTKAEVRRISHEIAVRDSVVLIDSPLKQKSNTNYFSKIFAVFCILSWKHYVTFWRRKTEMIMLLLLPMFVVFVSYSCVGRSPGELKLAIVVDDNYAAHVFPTTKLTPDFDFEAEEHIPYLPDILRNQFNKQNFTLVDFRNLSHAIEAVKYSKVDAVIYLAPNFSNAFYERDIYLNNAADWIDDRVNENGRIHLWLDYTNKFLSDIIKKEVTKTVDEFRAVAYEEIGVSRNISRLPLEIDVIHKINGSEYLQMTHYITLGFTITFMFGVTLTFSLIYFLAYNTGERYTRLLSAGVRPYQLIFSIMFTIFSMTTFCSVAVLLFIIYALNIHCNGSVVYALINLILITFSGTMTGLLLAQLMHSLFLSNIFSTAYFIGMILISGTIWPFESIPYFMRYLSISSPLMLPLSAFRYTFNYENIDFVTCILPGYLVSIAYIVFNTLLTIFILNRRK